MSRDRAQSAELVEAAIRREMDILGDGEAVALASEIDGLTVAGDGTVERIDRPTPVVLGELVDTYVAASGDIAAFVIAQRLANLVDGTADLPENVARHL